MTDGDDTPSDRQVPAHAHLPAEHHVVADFGAAGDADLRGHQHVASDGDAVGDLHEVVDLRAGLDARLADGGPIDGRVRAELDIVLDDHRCDLGDFLVCAVAPSNESVPVAADDDAVLEHDAVANRDALANRDVRVEDAVNADPRAGTNRHVRKDDRAIADDHSFAHGDERADRHAIAQMRIVRHSRHPVHSRLRLPSWREDADCPRKREVRIRRPEDRARPCRRVVTEQDGRCTRGGHRWQVLRIRDEGEIAGAGVFDAGDAHDLNLAIAFEAAGELCRKVPQFHCEFNLDGPRRRASLPPWLVAARISRVPNRNALEEGGQMLQPQTRGDLMDALFARRAMERCNLSQLRQRLARTSGPRDAVEPLRRAAH